MKLIYTFLGTIFFIPIVIILSPIVANYWYRWLRREFKREGITK